MKILFWNFSFCTAVLNFVSTVFSKILCFVKKERKHSQVDLSLPFTIKIQGQERNQEIQLADWEDWKDDSNFCQNETVGGDKGFSAEEELFKDMAPVIDKPKVVHVKRKVKSYQNNLNENTNRLGQATSLLKTKYEVKSELAMWEDEDPQDSGWNDVNFGNSEIEKETENMLKYNKLHEREKRAEEQRRKKEEKDVFRTKKNNQKLGVKIDMF